MENVALLCDKPWIAINESEDHELYIFNQDNTYLYGQREFSADRPENIPHGNIYLLITQ